MKTVVITGASGGVGSLLVADLCEKGWNVVGLSRSPPSDVAFGRFTHYPIDLSLLEQLPIELSGLSKKLPKIDALVLAHGSASSALAQQATLNDIKADMSLNFYASVMLIQGFSRNLARNGGGSVVALSSTQLRHHLTGCLSYNTTKAALEEACRCFAKEMFSLTISVNAVRLGVVDNTGMAKREHARSLAQLATNSLAGSPLAPTMVIKAILPFLSAHEIGLTGQIQSIGDL